MRSSHAQGTPFFSPISIALTVIFLVGLGVSLWLAGGSAFNPGPVTAAARTSGVRESEFGSHAEFENQCKLCHQPLRSDQAALCVQCHTEVGDQLSGAPGTHSVIRNARDCAACHREHQGRDFDPLASALASFDHNLTRLPLSGGHSRLECEDCHVGGNYTLTGSSCSNCHQQPPLHAGLFQQDCAECHTVEDWSQAVMGGVPFDHQQTRFSLALHQGKPGAPITCVDCHAAPDLSQTASRCADCHERRAAGFVAQHTAQFGEDCAGCHDGVDRLSNFNHATFFVLDGAHSALECQQCHAGQRYRGTPPACSGCHAEPEIHAGFFGLECQLCHTTSAWQPALLTAHAFPLDHGEQGEVACATCHTTTYPEYTCYGCHEHQPDEIAREHNEEGIGMDRLNACAECHSDGQKHESGGDD